MTTKRGQSPRMADSLAAWPRRHVQLAELWEFLGHVDPSSRTDVSTASAKPMGPGRLRDFGSHVRSVYQQMVRILITPCWARYYGFGAGRVPAFFARLSTS
jgi:hypothetical protein